MWKIDFPDMKPFLRILLPAAVCGLLLGACTQRQTTLKFMSYNIVCAAYGVFFFGRRP